MLFKTRSAAVYGIEAYLVDVEVNISAGGNGQFLIVGLPDTAVRESRNRVIAAIRNNGFGSPYQYIALISRLLPGVGDDVGFRWMPVRHHYSTASATS
jgi:hypothetical protein